MACTRGIASKESKVITWRLVLFSALSVFSIQGQTFQIGIIDLFGLNKVDQRQVRNALTFKERDTITLGDNERPAVFKASEDRLSKLPGVVRTQINAVCCESGRVLVYVGIQERGAPNLQFRAAPKGSGRLPADLINAGKDFANAMSAAVARGDAAEDRSKGHSLMHDPATRAIQENFITLANRDLPLLRRVLRNSSDAGHRALAAQLLGYASDKQAVVDELVHGMSDPDEQVRNNSMRALLVFAEAASTIRVPAEPFVRFLHSLVWSDKNKAAGALNAITSKRDPKVLSELRKSAIGPLAEMARWKSTGHAQPAFMILARIAGYADDAALKMWDAGNRETVISAAMK